MDYRDCLPRFPLLPGQPDRLLADLLDAQTALATVTYYISCWRAHPTTQNSALSRRHAYAAHEALHEARDIVDGVIEQLRIQVAETPLNDDEKKPDE
jgi:uncharacterized membrane protein YccC